MSLFDVEKFAVLRCARRVWAIPAIHGDAQRLMRLHDQLGERLQMGDRLVYLGNYLGPGGHVAETIDELLAFRRIALTLPGAEPDDIVFLRGAQEEMWRKLLELQFATEPAQVFAWMMAQGLEATLRAYGGDPAQAAATFREGALATTRWTGRLRQAIHARPGHDEFLAALKRAALTEGGEFLFVHAGVNHARPLDDQKDAFWWGGSLAVDRFEAPFAGFIGVIAGCDPGHGPARFGPYGGILDEGAGFGGTLAAYCFDLSGEVVDRLAA